MCVFVCIAGKDYDKTGEFTKPKCLAVNRSPAKHIYSHVINATDLASIRSVFESVQQQLLSLASDA